MSEEIKEIAESLREISTPTGLSYSGDRTLNNSYTEKIIDYINSLQQKVEQLENENFNIRENIHLERISLPPELTKDKDFMELYDIPSYKDLQQKVEQLEKRNKELRDENKRIFQNVNDDELLISNAMNYAELKKAEKKVEQLENIRKEAIEYINHATIGADSSPIEDSWLYNLYETRHILNKGE